MLYINYIVLGVLIVFLIIFCIVFRKKSLFFGLSVAWISLIIIIEICSICFKGNMANINPSALDDYMKMYSYLINFLKNINFVLFGGFLLSFYYRNRKSRNKDQNSQSF